ncbi:MAG: hypothetical protein ACYTG7_14570 [Planctomycetota bacterium]|jgi:hypothetical protein
MIFYISSNPDDLTGLREIYGMRHTGLIDTVGLFQEYRVPNPTAPYPQDYIIGKQGKIRFWEKEFDPEHSIKVIEELLKE